MTSRAKHQRKRKPARRPVVQQRPAPPCLFRMVAAANAGPSFSVGSELDLVKAALLYGDKVRSRAPWTIILAARQDVPNGGSLRGRANTQVALRDRLPRQPAYSAGRAHGCRLTTWAWPRSRAVPVALDPIRGM